MLQYRILSKLYYEIKFERPCIVQLLENVYIHEKCFEKIFVKPKIICYNIKLIIISFYLQYLLGILPTSEIMMLLIGQYLIQKYYYNHNQIKLAMSWTLAIKDRRCLILF